MTIPKTHQDKTNPFRSVGGDHLASGAGPPGEALELDTSSGIEYIQMSSTSGWTASPETPSPTRKKGAIVATARSPKTKPHLGKTERLAALICSVGVEDRLHLSS